MRLKFKKAIIWLKNYFCVSNAVCKYRVCEVNKLRWKTILLMGICDFSRLWLSKENAGLKIIRHFLVFTDRRLIPA